MGASEVCAGLGPMPEQGLHLEFLAVGPGSARAQGWVAAGRLREGAEGRHPWIGQHFGATDSRLSQEKNVKQYGGC